MLLLLPAVAVALFGCAGPAPLATVEGGDGFFPAEQPKMSLKSKNGGLTADIRRSGGRGCCDSSGGGAGFCCCWRAVKSVIARRTRTSATNWLRGRRQRRRRHITHTHPPPPLPPTLDSPRDYPRRTVRGVRLQPYLRSRCSDHRVSRDPMGRVPRVHNHKKTRVAVCHSHRSHF